MRIEIEIPKEFVEEFNKDRFEESLNRLLHDSHLLAGKYEREVAEMLITALKNAEPAYDVDKVIAELEDTRDYYKREKDEAEESIEYLSEHVYEEFRNKEFAMDIAIDIVKRGGINEE